MIIITILITVILQRVNSFNTYTKLYPWTPFPFINYTGVHPWTQPSINTGGKNSGFISGSSGDFERYNFLKQFLKRDRNLRFEVNKEQISELSLGNGELANLNINIQVSKSSQFESN